MDVYFAASILVVVGGLMLFAAYKVKMGRAVRILLGVTATFVLVAGISGFLPGGESPGSMSKSGVAASPDTTPKVAAASIETTAQRTARLAEEAKTAAASAALAKRAAAAAAARAKADAALAAVRGTDLYKTLTSGKGMNDAQARSFITAASLARLSSVENVASRQGRKGGDIFKIVSNDGSNAVRYAVHFKGNSVSTISDTYGVTLYARGRRNSRYVFWTDVGGPTRVVDVTKTVVKSLLKSPSTADFPGGWLDPLDGWTFAKPSGKVTVTSYVDSQNSFGAMLRSKFQVVYKVSTGKHKGRLTPSRIIFDGRLMLDK